MPYGFIFSALILTTLLFPRLGKASYLMTHDRFYALSTEEQNQVIIKTMEMASELESQFPHAKVSKSNLQTQKNFSFILNHLQKLILAEAFADPQRAKLFENYAQDFIKLTSGADKKEKCLYAGWVSKLKVGISKTTGKEILTCPHPQSLDKKSDEYKAYVKAEKKCDFNDNETPKISCNPAIFGFKKGSEQSLFCVDAGLVGSADSSIECMKLSLEEFPKDQTKVDSKETRLKLMREALAAKPELLEGVQRFMFKTCFCENNENSIDKRYMNRVRPHRTCYGLMRTIAETTSCEINGSTVANADDFKIITKNLDQNIQLSRYQNPNYDNFYKEFLAKAQAESKEDVKRICNTQTPVLPAPTSPAPTEESKTNDNSDSPYTCSVTCSETTTTGPLPGLGSEDNADLKDNNKKSPTLSMLNPAPQYSASLIDTNQFKVEDPMAAWNHYKFGGSTTKNCEYKVTKKDGDKTTDLKDDEYTKPTEAIEAQEKVLIKIKADEKEVECPIGKAPKPAATQDNSENKCTLTFSEPDSDKKITVKAALDNEVEGDRTYKWDDNGSVTDSAIFDFKEDLEVKGSITLADASVIPCAEKYKKQESKPGEVTTFEIIPGEVTLTSKKFSVKINDKAEIPSGFIVIWFRDEAGQKLDIKKPGSDKPKASEKPAVAPDSDASQDEKAPNDKPKDEIKGEVGRGPEITEFRSPLNTFKICAQLLKEGVKIDKKCSDVPRIEAPRNQGSGRPNIPFVTPIHNPANWTIDGIY